MKEADGVSCLKYKIMKKRGEHHLRQYDGALIPKLSLFKP
jgi:hypothetical protein